MQIKTDYVHVKTTFLLYMVDFWSSSVYASKIGGPQGFWGSGENGYLFSESWGELVIILGELGRKLIVLGI